MGLIRLPSGAVLHITGSGPPVLFLHGVGGGAWSWAPQVERLTREYRLYVWEARGHGDAGRTEDAGLADYYEDAVQALNAAHADARTAVTIVAHSMGGLLALALAANDPAAVAGLFLIDPVYTDGSDAAYGHVTPGLGAFVRALCMPLIRSFEHDGWTSRVIARSVFKGAFTNRDRMEAAWSSQRRQVPFEYPRMLKESFTRPEGFELRDFAAEIQAPVFLLDVSRSDGGSRFPQLMQTFERRLGARFAHASIDGGHYLQLDRFEDVDDYLEAFLRRNAAPV